MRRALTPAGLAVGAALLLAAAATPHGIKEGGTFRISLQTGLAGLDFVDPALASTPAAWAHPRHDLRAPSGVPGQGRAGVLSLRARSRESSPRSLPIARRTRSRYAKAFASTTEVRPARAFARAIDRMLAPGLGSPGAQHVREIVGAAEVLAGNKTSASGVVARGHTLVVRLTRPAPDFLHRTTSTFFCAVPPALPADPRASGRSPPRARITLPSTVRASVWCCDATLTTAGRGRIMSTGSSPTCVRLPPGGARRRRARRGRLGPHDVEHLLRAGSESHREVRARSLAVLRQARIHAANARLQFGAAVVQGQHEVA